MTANEIRRRSMVKSLWYVLHSILQNNETAETAQRKGVILIMYVKHYKLAAVNRKVSQACTEALKGVIPIRISAIHVCHTPRIFELIYAVYKLFMGADLRKKVQIHNGSEEMVLKKLNDKFGISSDKVPTEMGGTYKLDYLEWFDERQKRGL